MAETPTFIDADDLRQHLDDTLEPTERAQIDTILRANVHEVNGQLSREDLSRLASGDAGEEVARALWSFAIRAQHTTNGNMTSDVTTNGEH